MEVQGGIDVLLNFRPAHFFFSIKKFDVNGT